MLSKQSNNKPKLHRKILKKKKKEIKTNKYEDKSKNKYLTQEFFLKLDFDRSPRSIYKTKYPEVQ